MQHLQHQRKVVIKNVLFEGFREGVGCHIEIVTRYLFNAFKKIYFLVQYDMQNQFLNMTYTLLTKS